LLDSLLQEIIFLLLTDMSLLKASKVSNKLEACEILVHSNSSENPPKPSNLFGVPAILSKKNSSESSQDYTFIFIHKDVKQCAVLQPTFLTAVEKDGKKTTWEDVKSCLIVGCKVKFDVTKFKPASFTGEWLVFGLYLSDVLTEKGDKENTCSTASQRRRFSKEFDWMGSFGKGLGSEDESFNKIESQLSDIEDSIFVYGSELTSAEKALLEVREKLDDCMNYSQGSSQLMLSPGMLNETFTVEENMESPFLLSSSCQHQYEVGVVAISVTQQCLQLVGPLNSIWVRTEVRPCDTPVYSKEGRVVDTCQVSVGDIGTLVSSMCVKCQLDTTMECLAPPLMLWFGEEQRPSVRGLHGKVVWSDEDKFLVQLDGSESEPVLFMRSERDMMLKTGWQLLVWAWSKPGTCAEGGAWISQASQLDASLVRHFENLDLSTSGIFSPVRENLKEVVNGRDITRSVDKADSDKCSDVSFGSVSECDEIDLDKSFNTNLSMLINSTSIKLMSQEEEFQTLYSGTSFPFNDNVDIDLRFEQVLTANGLVGNYEKLTRKYEDYFLVSQSSSIIANDSGSSLNTDQQIDHATFHSPPRISLEFNPQDVLPNPSFLKRMPGPSLSPIPEEVNESFSDNPVFSTPLCKSAEDSGYNDSFCSGSNTINHSRSLVYSAEKAPLSAFSEDATFKQPCYKEMLDQFLEFTQFPASRRNDLIDHFITSNLKENA